MFAKRIVGFAGVLPRLHKRLLNDNQAQIAVNARLTNGQIDSLRAPVLLHNPGVSGLTSIFRMVSSSGTEKWLTWAKDVDVVRGPVAGDTAQRIYWTGDGEPRMSVFADATAGGGPYPSTFYVLGASPPTAAPTVGHTGGSAANITVAFVYTFVTALGEESQPSPAGSHSAPSDATSWDLSGMQAAPLNTIAVTGASWSGGVATVTCASGHTRGLRVGEEVNVTGITPSGYNGSKLVLTEVNSGNVKYALASDPGTYSSGGSIARVAPHNYSGGLACKRIYATITGASGETEYRLWADNVSIGATSYGAAYSATAIAAATLLPSVTWAQPPVGLTGLISLANGINVGFAGNEVCFSEPYYPHAWPSGYRQALAHNPVALGAFGTTVVVATDGTPYTISGVDPATMGGGAQKIDEAWPCVSKRGMVSASFGVMYPTRQGLVLIGHGGAQIATREFYTEEEWRNVMPATFKAAAKDNKYYAAYDADDTFSYVIIIDKTEFASVTVGNYKCARLWTDPLTGTLYAVIEDKIYEWDSTDAEKTLYDWMSKEFLLPYPLTLVASKVDADFTSTEEEILAAETAYAAVLAANQAMINAGYIGGAAGIIPIGLTAIGGNLLELPPDLVYGSLLFEFYVNNALKYSTQVRSTSAFRLPSGYKADNFAVRVAGNVRVSGIVVGDSMQALKAA